MIARTRIGSTDLEIAALAFGGNVLGWTADRDTSFDVLDAFVAGGGDFIDTADGYSHWVPTNTGGESETIIGQWLAKRGNRERITLASKVSTHPEFKGLAATNIHAAIDASLQRLGVEQIDLYYAHYDDADTPLEETAAAFSALVDAGKIRYIGISNYTAERATEWMRIAHAEGLHTPVALQPLYNLVERGFETNGLRDLAEREDLAVFPYYSLAHGFLTGKYRQSADAAAPGASDRAPQAAEYLNPRGMQVLETLDRIAAEYDVELATVALAWLRQQPVVTAPIASARNTEQLPALLASLSIELSAAELEALTAASA